MSTASETDHTNDRMHGGWLEHKSTEKNKWNPVWCVLKRDGTLFFFTSQQTSLETHIGTLHVTRESSFHYVTGDAREGYRFDLYIQKKKKKFRVKKPYDRELWRAYLLGVITGSVPQDGNLSPQDLQTASDKFHLHQQQKQVTSPTPFPSFPIPTTNTSSSSSSSSSQRPVFSTSPSSSSISSADRRPAAPVPKSDDGSSSVSSWQVGRERRGSLPSMVSSGTGSSGEEGGFDPPGLRNIAEFSIRGPSDGSSDSGVKVIDTGGPFMHHKFDKEGSNSPPSWFFEDCSRQLAEKILNECRHMGNTLMRVSGSARPTGSYVISKRLESSDGIVHYEVIRVAEGYKINAENITNTMRTLREVMDFFIQLSGAATTRPLLSNDLKELGVHYDAYHRGPILPHLGAPATSAEEDGPQDNYEIPQQQSPRGAPASSSQAPPPPPQAPPPPPPAPSPPPSSPGKAAPFIFKPPNTWGKDKQGPLKWQTKEAASAGMGAKTFSPGERRQMKPADSASASAKPSVMQVNQSLEEHHVVANLDAVIRVEEEKFQHKGGQQQQDQRPPLPAVPVDRPRLCSLTGTPTYVNVSSSPGGDGTEEGSVHQRWNKRSQSLPVLQKDLLARTVAANVAPPSVVKPAGGAGTGGGSGGKAPPPTAPKSTRGFPQSKASSADGLEKPAVSNILPELQLKLKQRALQCEEQQSQASSTATATSANSRGGGGGGGAGTGPLSSRALPSPPSAAAEDDVIVDDEEYEDISQYYQNVSSK